MEGREDVLEAREERFLFLLRAGRLLSSKDGGAFVCLILEQVAHANVIDLAVGLMNVSDRLGNLRISCRVVLDVRADALTMEGVQTRIDEELTIVKDCAKADIAVLGRVDRDVLVLLMTSLRTQELSVLRVSLNLVAKLFNLLLVVIKTVAQMLLHVTDFSLLREQIEQVFNLKNVVLANDLQGLLDLDLMTIAVWHFSSEQVLGNLHPELLSCLATVWLVGIVSRHHSVIDLKCLLYSLRVKIKDAI